MRCRRCWLAPWQSKRRPIYQGSRGCADRALGGRWTCRSKGHIFHEKYNPPQKAGICDLDGSELYQREDDKEETVRNRIQVYFAQTMPLIEYYQKAGLLIEIDGAQPIEQVTADLLAALTKKA